MRVLLFYSFTSYLGGEASQHTSQNNILVLLSCSSSCVTKIWCEYFTILHLKMHFQNNHAVLIAFWKLTGY